MLEIPSAVGLNSGTLSVRAQFGADDVPLPSAAVAGAFQQQLAGILIPTSTGSFTIETATGRSAGPSGRPGGVFPNQDPVDAPGLDPTPTVGLVALLLSETTAPNLDVRHLASPLVDFVNLPNSSAGGQATEVNSDLQRLAVPGTGFAGFPELFAGGQVADSNPGVRHLTARGTGFADLPEPSVVRHAVEPNAHARHSVVSGTNFVDPSEQPSVSRSTAPLRPLQSVVFFGPGDVARASAPSTGPTSLPSAVEPGPADRGNLAKGFSRVQVIAETLPRSREGVGFESSQAQPTGVEPRLPGAPAPTLGGDEAVRERVVDTAVRSSNPSFASNPESSQMVSIGPSISRPIAIRNRTAKNQPSIGVHLNNTEDQQSSPVASSDPIAPVLPRARPGGGQVPNGILNQQAAEAGSEQKPLVTDAETGAEDSQSSRATSDQRSAEGIVTKKLPTGNGPTGPFVKVSEDYIAESVEPQQTTQLQSHEDAAETSPIPTKPRWPGSPQKIPVLEVAATFNAFGNPHGDRVLPAIPQEVKTPWIEETVVEQTALGAETTARPNEESSTSARETIVQETAPADKRANEPSAKTEAVASNRGESELPDRVQLLQRVAQALRTARISGEQVRMRLHPPDLGSLSIEVALREGVLTARLEVVTEAARALLLNNLSTLRENLAQQNVEIDRFDVDVAADNHGGRARDGFDQQSGQTSREHPSSPVSRQDAGPAARQEETLEAPKPGITTSGLDVMA